MKLPIAHRGEPRRAPEGDNGRRHWAISIALTLAFFMTLGLAGLGSSPARSDGNIASRTATRTLSPELPPPALKIPDILSAQDVKFYRKIFALQKTGRWRAAKRLIGKLDSRLLMGHVLAQRYLHPTKYWSSYGELARWMKHYADHPDAKRIYRLALRRKPKGAKAPRAPKPYYSAANARFKDKAQNRRNRRAAGRYSRRAERSLLRHIRHLVRREYLSAAERYLEQPKIRRAIRRAGIDRARGIIAGGWFRWGKPARALKLAGRAVKGSGRAAPQAAWWAGLASFKLGRYADAGRFFAIGAKAPNTGPQENARAAFWAARANLVGRRPEQVNHWLQRAAAHPRTFYGLIATHILGGAPSFNWAKPAIDGKQLETLMATPPGRRALALLQVGQGRRAGRELRPYGYANDPANLRTIIALADVVRLPGTAYRAARTLKDLLGERIDAGLYPIPPWEPGVYSIDRALVFALTRQESAFNSRAKSRSGARGLMQLMPATARYMSGSRRAFRGRNLSRLYDPKINLALGQKYVDYLLTGDIVAGNIIMMISAYNGGPGNTAKWQLNVPHGSDPLVFIETIPRRETRLFVKRVLENLWIYRMRLGQDAPTLTALAGGRWPYYVRLDGARLGIAQERP